MNNTLSTVARLRELLTESQRHSVERWLREKYPPNELAEHYPDDALTDEGESMRPLWLAVRDTCRLAACDHDGSRPYLDNATQDERVERAARIAYLFLRTHDPDDAGALEGDVERFLYRDAAGKLGLHQAAEDAACVLEAVKRPDDARQAPKPRKARKERPKTMVKVPTARDWERFEEYLGCKSIRKTAEQFGVSKSAVGESIVRVRAHLQAGDATRQ